MIDNTRENLTTLYYFWNLKLLLLVSLPRTWETEIRGRKYIYSSLALWKIEENFLSHIYSFCGERGLEVLRASMEHKEVLVTHRHKTHGLAWVLLSRTTAPSLL
jgi:hypothetical protein